MKRRPFLIIGLILFLHCCTILRVAAGNIPPFRITQPNGKSFRAENIPFEKPILIVYFSPDCDDCLHFLNNFFSNISAFDKAYVVMISYLSLEEVAKMHAKYKMSQHRNITIGVEGAPYFVRNYYNITALHLWHYTIKMGNLYRHIPKIYPFPI